jgi:hypothetical protein
MGGLFFVAKVISAGNSSRRIVVRLVSYQGTALGVPQVHPPGNNEELSSRHDWARSYLEIQSAPPRCAQQERGEHEYTGWFAACSTNYGL